jgi:YidC/Oxa1 family membrane protein insertase
MKELYVTVLFQPIWNILVWLYTHVPGRDIGLAIIGLTVLVRIILWPFQQSALKSQKALQNLQPKLKALQEQYKDDKAAMSKATMELYAKEKVSPFSSCLPLLIQFPFLIALYQVLNEGLTKANFDLLYPFVASPGGIDPTSFGLVNLAKASIPLAILAGVAQLVQTKMLPMAPQASPPPGAGVGAKDEDRLARVNKQMLYLMPAFTVFIGASLPGGLTLYWLVTTLVAIFQQWLFLRNHKKLQAALTPPA